MSYCCWLQSQVLAHSLLLVVLLFIPAQSSADWAFLQDQSRCQLHCLNGGVCAFLVRQPEQYKCICLIGMFQGERCEQSTNVEKQQEMLMEEEEKGGEAADDNGEDNEHWDPEEAGGEETEQNMRSRDGQPQHFPALETNTMGSRLEHFAESHRRPMAAQREEYEEPAMKGTKEGRGGGKRKKGKARQQQRERDGERQQTTTTMTEGGDGWMLTRRGARAAGMRTADVGSPLIGWTMAAGTMAAIALLWMG